MPDEKKPQARVVVEEIKTEKATEVTPEPETKEEINKKAKEEKFPKETEIPPSDPINFLWVIIPGMILLGLLVGGIFAYYSGMNKLKTNQNITKTTTSESTPSANSPTPTPTVKPDLTQYKIKILNGSGIKGEAGKVQTLLEKAGFKVESTGNAKTYDYTQTIIQAKSSIEENFLVSLKENLSKSYKVAKNETLKDTEASSVIIIVGSSKAE